MLAAGIGYILLQLQVLSQRYLHIQINPFAVFALKSAQYFLPSSVWRSSVTSLSFLSICSRESREGQVEVLFPSLRLMGNQPSWFGFGYLLNLVLSAHLIENNIFLPD